MKRIRYSKYVPDPAGDKREMDQAQARTTARTVYGIEAAAPHRPDLELGF